MTSYFISANFDESDRKINQCRDSAYILGLFSLMNDKIKSGMGLTGLSNEYMHSSLYIFSLFIGATTEERRVSMGASILRIDWPIKREIMTLLHVHWLDSLKPSWGCLLNLPKLNNIKSVIIPSADQYNPVSESLQEYRGKRSYQNGHILIKDVGWCPRQFKCRTSTTR